ncbi:MAG: D-tyrosyl-tRNA(Tyr) deacylase [Tidjanibacter sp.]|nr:D-tyrosyl-tRNA(Tyr) deacylase [Tidjanibacter sp.]
MRALVQRVAHANVVIEGEQVAQIGHGLLIFVGVATTDTEEDVDYLVKKCSQLRIFDDENGVMNLDVRQVDGQALVVSQFTLQAATRKGNRPSYIHAAGEAVAVPLYESFKAKLATAIGKPIPCGRFGADMKVTLLNDGPVTIWIDSQDK